MKPQRKHGLLAVAAAVGLLGSVTWLVRGSRERGRPLAPSAVAERADVPRELPEPASAIPAVDLTQRTPLSALTPVEPGVSLPPTSRGRLVDETTLEPIADALVSTGRGNDASDEHGWFDTGAELDGLAEVVVMNVASNSGTHEIPRERWTRFAEGWRIPLAIGPTFRLRFRGARPPEDAVWEARLVQDDFEEHPWRSVRSCRTCAALPQVRYDRPIAFLEPGSPAWLEVRTGDGAFDGRAAVPRWVGIQELEAELRERAVLTGRVVDELGAARENVVVHAVQLSSRDVERDKTITGSDGTYLLHAGEPGRMELAFFAPGRTAPLRRTVQVPAGEMRAPDIVLPRVAPAGAVRGTVRSTTDGFAAVQLRLRALDPSGYEQRTEATIGSKSARKRALLEEGRSPVETAVARFTDASGSFAFLDVPPGRFELVASSEQGFACSPAALEIEPPAADIVLTIADHVPTVLYGLEVRAADTGERLEAFRSWLRIGGSDASETSLRSLDGTLRRRVVADARFDWTVMVPGYELAHVTERDFPGEAPERRTLLELRPGFSARFEFEDVSTSLVPFVASTHVPPDAWRTPRIAGVEVRADGEVVAVSDARGVAEIVLAAEPQRIEFSKPGMRVVYSPVGLELDSFVYGEVRMIRE